MSDILDAIASGDLEQLSKIIEADPASVNVPADERAPLHYAAVYGHMHIVRYLIQHGADLNARDEDGLQPIHKACEFGHFDVVRVLLDNGVEIESAVNNAGWTPLYYAAGNGNVDVVRLLINRGADVNREDVEGGIPLSNAVCYGRYDAAKLLIEHGSNVNAEDGYTTVLCYAVETEDLKLVKLIVESGADVNAVDFDGEAPLDMARCDNLTEIAEYLEQCGAKDYVEEDDI